MEFCSSNSIVNLIIPVVGVILLIKGSDWFIDGASSLARRLRISEMVIGLTLVSLGTSLPEFATNIYASGMGQGDIALGNIVGSNISNILLILGVGAMLTRKIAISPVVLFRDGMSMFGITLLCLVFCLWGRELNRLEGLILLLGMMAYLGYLFRHREVLEAEIGDEHQEDRFNTVRGAVTFLIVGLVLLVGGAKMLVDNVVWFSIRMHLDQAVIGATVVALGTSLPELAVTVGGVMKNKHDIALGNIIGSNFFNIGLILGLSALISPIQVSPVMLSFNLPVMMISSVMLLVFMRSGWRLVRMEGATFFLGYVLFIAWNVWHIKG